MRYEDLDAQDQALVDMCAKLKIEDMQIQILWPSARGLSGTPAWMHAHNALSARPNAQVLENIAHRIADDTMAKD